MEVSISSPKEWLREINVEVEPQKLKAKVDEMLATYGARAEIPGFRRGKAPKAVVERRLGSALEQAAVEDIVKETSAEVLEKQTFRVASEARLEDLEVTPEKAIRLKLSLEVFPDFELKDYTGLKLKKEEPTGFEQEFEKRLKELQDKCATFKPVLRPAKELDFVSCDYQMLDGDNPLGTPKTNVMIQVGDKMNFEPVNKALVGAKPGDELEAAVEIPTDHPDKAIAGKTVSFKFKIREVKEKLVPEVSEEFASDLGFENLDALRKDMNDQIMHDRARLVANGLKNQVFDFLVKEHEFEPPESWVKASYERLMREYELPDDEETKTKLMAVAARRAKFDVVAARIAEQEKLGVTEEEIRTRIEDLAKSTKRSVEEIAPLLDNPAYRNQALREKVLDFVLDKAHVG